MPIPPLRITIPSSLNPQPIDSGYDESPSVSPLTWAEVTDEAGLARAIKIFVTNYINNRSMIAFAREACPNVDADDQVATYIDKLVRTAVKDPCVHVVEAYNFNWVALGEIPDFANLRNATWTKASGLTSWWLLRDDRQRVRSQYAISMIHGKQGAIGHASRHSSGENHLMGTPLRPHYVLGMIAQDLGQYPVQEALDEVLSPFIGAAEERNLKVWYDTTEDTTELERRGFELVRSFSIGRNEVNWQGEVDHKGCGFKVECLVWKPKKKNSNS
ncbi:hypothetical protein EJ05DRAFT_479664 [Pseudovirgaria hyperparasitica]|uniref:Uncharacterized protein n=1 Tax=Pseudovirgaria hyperparasitica TaxID=470096 RepID=A0A6A6VWE6_9PEZI|nr:uncharacterized protein EJ05DRAFT_479664 [Pseudovirgaria hyperparasitica]KAF2754116.1 hypothetical protein EJ05DRAFT_479664 [Pseudovirgaria hyperparasitica]